MGKLRFIFLDSAHYFDLMYINYMLNGECYIDITSNFFSYLCTSPTILDG
jgi:hypothetical protein